MKHAEKCPKCNGLNIYRAEKSRSERSYLAVAAFSRAKVEIYICSECGYIEEYLKSKEDLEKIIKHGTKI